jgi:WhiB family redox-sensing transcriptional regulator
MTASEERLAAPLGPRQAAVLARLEEHPGLTAGELARFFGLSTSLYQLLGRLQQRALVVAVTAWDPAQGRRVSRWHPAPPGTAPPPPQRPADPVEIRRRRERDRVSQRARRARARGPVIVAALAVPDLPGAACLGAGPGLFFPAEEETAAARYGRQAQAMAVCAGCPVRARCYQGAADRGEPWGIWGGADVEESRRERRRRAS